MNRSKGKSRRISLIVFSLLLCGLSRFDLRGEVIAWGGNEYGQTNVSANATNVVALSGGFGISMALTAGGTPVVWGDGSDYEYNIPAGATNVVAIGSGMFDHLVLKADGTVVQWGNVSYKQAYGYPPAATNILSISTLRAHSLGLKSDGTVVAWGNNDSGQATVPAGLSNVIAVAAGGDHSLALKADGKVVAWGDNSAGQCNVPVGLSNVVAISAGWSQSVALKSDGTVTAWSDNSMGAAPCMTNVVAIAGGLALRADGTLADWSGDCGALNNLSNVMSLAEGYNQALVVTGAQSPQVFQQPTGLTVLAEGTALFRVSAIGSAPMSYQWQLNGTNITGATAPTLLLTHIQPAQAGQYSVIVSNSLSPAASSNATLTVLAQILTSQPTNQTVFGGDDTTMAVTAQGAGLNYQWRRSGADLANQTNAQLVIHNTTTNDAENYSVVVSDSYGFIESSNATLTVTPISFSMQPTNRSAYVGDTTVFAAAVLKNGPFSYQWRYNGGDLAGKTNSSLTLTNLALGDAGNYSVLASNPYGSLESSPAVLTVADSKPVILTQPVASGVYLGGSNSFQVIADGTKPLAYQWRLNGTNIPGATSSTLLLANITKSNGGDYSVLVSNAVGSTLSSNATLAILNVTTWGQTNSYGLNLISLALTDAVAVAVGNSHSVALKANGRVVAWGYNGNGQTNVPASATNVIAIAAGQDHTLALRSNGTVVAWGNGGIGVPAGLSNVIAVSAGDYHSMALKSDGTVVVWGDSPNVGSSVTNPPANATNIVAIATGGSFCVALKQDGRVLTWGNVVTIPNITNAVAIAASEFPIVVLKADGRVFATNVLAAPAGLSNAVGVAAGRYHSMALKSDGTITNWVNSGPVTPAGLSNVVALASGQYHCLAIVGSGPHTAEIPLANLKRISNSFSLSMPSQYGHLYWLEYKTSLTDTNWKTQLLNPGISNSVTLTDGAATNSMRIYRARQW